MPKAKILTMPALPAVNHGTRRRSDPRYIEGQRIIVQAIRYLVQSDAAENLAAVEFFPSTSATSSAAPTSQRSCQWSVVCCQNEVDRSQLSGL